MKVPLGTVALWLPVGPRKFGKSHKYSIFMVSRPGLEPGRPRVKSPSGSRPTRPRSSRKPAPPQREVPASDDPSREGVLGVTTWTVCPASEGMSGTGLSLAERSTTRRADPLLTPLQFPDPRCRLIDELRDPVEFLAIEEHIDAADVAGRDERGTVHCHLGRHAQWRLFPLRGASAGRSRRAKTGERVEPYTKRSAPLLHFGGWNTLPLPYRFEHLRHLRQGAGQGNDLVGIHNADALTIESATICEFDPVVSRVWWKREVAHSSGW